MFRSYGPFCPVARSAEILAERWLHGRLRAEELDPGLLTWDVHRRLHIDRFPERRTVLRFEFADARAKQRFYWLVIDAGEVDICVKDPGFEVDLYVVTDVRTLTEVRLGDLTPAKALREERIRLHGPRRLARQFRSWLRLSVFADVPREGARAAPA